MHRTGSITGRAKPNRRQLLSPTPTPLLLLAAAAALVLAAAPLAGGTIVNLTALPAPQPCLPASGVVAKTNMLRYPDG